MTTPLLKKRAYRSRESPPFKRRRTSTHAARLIIRQGAEEVQSTSLATISTNTTETTQQDATKKYSTRVITWPEQKALGGRFKEVGKGNWPARAILEERGRGKIKEYLVDWEKHPIRDDEFEPTWIAESGIGSELLDEWKTSGAQRISTPVKTTAQKSTEYSNYILLKETAAARARNNAVHRRVVPDSSDDFRGEENEDGDLTIPSSPPTFASAATPTSSLSQPGFEIAETQEPLPAKFAIQLPPTPDDKYDFESGKGTQSSQEVSHVTILSSWSQGQIFHSPLEPFPQTLSRPAASPLARASVHSSGANVSQNRPRSASQAQSSLQYWPKHTNTASQPQDANPFPPNETAIGSQFVNHVAPNAQSPFEKPAVQRQSWPAPICASRPYSPAEFKSATQLQDFLTQIPYQQSDLASPILVEGPLETPLAPLYNNAMSVQATRHSPRLRSIPADTDRRTSRVSVRSTSRRSGLRISSAEATSPLAASVPVPGTIGDSVIEPASEGNIADDTTAGSVRSQTFDMEGALSQSDSIAPSAMHLDGPPSTDGSPALDVSVIPSSLMIQQSIEEEPQYSAEDTTSLVSKASSSQESLKSEQQIESVDGIMIPTHPVLGPDEYTIPLPAEGKVKAMYEDTVRLKRKAILKFVHRTGSTNTARSSPRRVEERSDMLELVCRLHNITTHMDLGLPGMSTQYSLSSQEHAAYAEYAGSKFVFLGHLVDYLRDTDRRILIVAETGELQNLLVNFLQMKHVPIHSEGQDLGLPQYQNRGFMVELLSTPSRSDQSVKCDPSLVIFFDTSGSASNPHIQNVRKALERPIPILHLLVCNSSEHVERCIPQSLPSPLRLKALVRTTFQAVPHLGGPATYIPHASDEPEGRPMDMSDVNRAVRKSPARRIFAMATIAANAVMSGNFKETWALDPMPGLELEELDEAPPKSSQASTSPVKRVRDSRTPVVRDGTPSGRKRFLEPDLASLAKRQRLTPTPDSLSGTGEIARTQTGLNNAQTDVTHLMRHTARLEAELKAEQTARQTAEDQKSVADVKAAEWARSVAELQTRYERRRTRMKDLEKTNKAFAATIESSKVRQEKLNEENVTLRDQVKTLRADLVTARNDLKAGGGDMAALETAREEARTAVARAATLDKTAETSKKDFDFLRSQYQDTSNRAVELSNQVADLEKTKKRLEADASEEKRRLKVLNYERSIDAHIAKAAQFEAEVRNLSALNNKLQKENEALKKTRTGMQTRGSSVQPAGTSARASPGPRSRQASPATGLLAPPSGSRASLLRHGG